MKTRIKQLKILNIFNKFFPDKRLDKLTEDNFNVKRMSKKELYWFMECVWIDLGKTQATKKEISRGIENVYTLMILEDLRRHGLLRINKKGFFDKTKLGKQVNDALDKLNEGEKR